VGQPVFCKGSRQTYGGAFLHGVGDGRFVRWTVGLFQRRDADRLDYGAGCGNGLLESIRLYPPRLSLQYQLKAARKRTAAAWRERDEIREKFHAFSLDGLTVYGALKLAAVGAGEGKAERGDGPRSADPNVIPFRGEIR
jgi:hypothetical protein